MELRNHLMGGGRPMELRNHRMEGSRPMELRNHRMEDSRPTRTSPLMGLTGTSPPMEIPIRPMEGSRLMELRNHLMEAKPMGIRRLMEPMGTRSPMELRPPTDSPDTRRIHMATIRLME